jgi:cyclophilin family peptidyl-prolyl cis-trans isomerase
MHKFLLPLFVLALLLVSCSSTPAMKTTPRHEGALLSGKHTVVMHTTKGDITLALDADVAPKTVTNFVELAKTGYYNKLTFHRVIPSFMIQGGDPVGNGTGGESVFGETFNDEINADSYGLHKKKLKDIVKDMSELPDPAMANWTLKQFYERQGYHYDSTLTSLPMKRGAIAMANRGPNTNGSQFFIIHAPSTEWLEGKHTVFGNVTSGLEVVDAITKVARDENDKPIEGVSFTVEVKN